MCVCVDTYSYSVTQSCLTLWSHGLQHDRLPCPSLSLTLLKLTSIELVIPLNHFILCRSLHLMPSVFPSIREFSNEWTLYIRWLKYWSFSFSINPSNEYSGFISFRIDWFDLLAVQGNLKSLLQHHNSKASILWHSAFCMVQLTSIHDYWKTIALTIWTLSAKWYLCFLIHFLGTLKIMVWCKRFVSK